MTKSFKERVLAVVRSIPRGSVLSYMEVAKKAGSPKAYRVVGNIMRANQDTTVPCHRVIRSDGTLSKYNGLLGKTKEEVLLKEGYIWTTTTT